MASLQNNVNFEGDASSSALKSANLDFEFQVSGALSI